MVETFKNPAVDSVDPMRGLTDLIERQWGFRTLRPLQDQAMRSMLAGRDSLLVLPTGGGKSLCYQAPAAYRGGTTVVISPLISLMKDQVDSLKANGVPAIQLDSSQTAADRATYESLIRQGEIRLLFVSPERMVLTDFHRLLQQIDVKALAIDEAHCISHWGHDFRPEYRQLSRLKEFFPSASIHGYTATATERVRRDIVKQLNLKDPDVLVGNFDRPNLTYRILPLHDLNRQVVEVLDRHKKEAGIVYCIRRADVDELADFLQSRKYKAMPYHAGMSTEDRKATQEAFAAEKCDIVVATVAFGMGIHRSNIRFVLHTGMPKSIEHYQQETGRAGRDGLEAECVLLHSGNDFMTWKWIIEKSASEPGVDPTHLPASIKHLEDMDRYCRGAVCRHRALVQYFDQEYEPAICGACDICLGDAEEVPDAVTIAQKILSCVARVKESFGIGHVISVLRGEDTESVRKWHHEKLSTYGLLRENSKADVRDWIYQLIGQSALAQEEINTASGFRAAILKLNAASWEVMRKERVVRLMQLVRREKGEKPQKSKKDEVSWEGVDRELFEALREQRKSIAESRGLPTYVIFNDATLRELARVRPSTLPKMRYISGIGDVKLSDFGQEFLKVIDYECRLRQRSRDNQLAQPVAIGGPAPPPKLTQKRAEAYNLFRNGKSIAEVAAQTERAETTISGYLEDFIREERPEKVSRWILDELYERIAAVANEVGTQRLKPIFLELDSKVSYEDIRIVVAHLQATKPPAKE